ncbi:hypothetical protein [Deinococcus phoenicis]|nr:hypothetical protein [Deinococcus phoenicis]
MSLDVTLIRTVGNRCPCCGRGQETETVFDANITHNLNRMASEAGLYEAVWRPDEHGYTHAHQIIPVLERGIAEMEADPERFKAFDSPNGWGLYIHLLPWLQRYLTACREYPDALIEVCR